MKVLIALTLLLYASCWVESGFQENDFSFLSQIIINETLNSPDVISFQAIDHDLNSGGILEHEATGDVEEDRHTDVIVSHPDDVGLESTDREKIKTWDGVFYYYNYDEVYNNRTHVYNYVYNNSVLEENALVVTAVCEEATQNLPVTVTVNQKSSGQNWQIPWMELPGIRGPQVYPLVSRIICPATETVPQDSPMVRFSEYKEESLTISVSSQALKPMEFAMGVHFFNKFYLKPNDTKLYIVPPAKPIFLRYNFPAGMTAVTIELSSQSYICTAVSLQIPQCPVHDREELLKFGRYYFTMTKQASISVNQDDFPDGFYLVLVTLLNDGPCKTEQYASRYSSERNKFLTIKTIPKENYKFELLWGIGSGFLFGVVVFSIALSALYLKRKSPLREMPPARPAATNIYTPLLNSTENNYNEVTQQPSFFQAISIPDNEVDDNYSVISLFDSISTSTGLANEREGDFNEQQDKRGMRDRNFTNIPIIPIRARFSSTTYGLENHHNLRLENYQLNSSLRSNVSSLDLLNQIDYENNEESNYRLDAEGNCFIDSNDTFISNTLLNENLSTEDYNALKRIKTTKQRGWRYFKVLLSSFLMYAIPALQLVVAYKRSLDESGNLDTCFYNFKCMTPFGSISDFSHLISNSGYVFFGLLYGIITYQRSVQYEKQLAENKTMIHLGLIKDFGMDYALAASLMMEGILSACYHVCPNEANFQFDTTFMYTISLIFMLRLYQKRHPVTVASAESSFLFISIVVTFGVIGCFFSLQWFWITTSVVHVFICLVMSFNIYYHGRWSALSVFSKIRDAFKRGCISTFFLSFRTVKNVFSKRHLRTKLLFLLVANIVNWIVLIIGVHYRPFDYDTFLLSIFLTNLVVYIVFYVFMKICNKEHISREAMAVLVLLTIAWGGAIVLFFQHTIDWKASPASSRELNQPCVLFGFYDYHDLWHYLSALALFLSFYMISVIDKDLEGVPRDLIPIF